MGFWEQANDQAGREFGARFWRWFLAGRALRRAAPGIAVVVIVVLLVWAYRLISPDWPAVARGAGRWAAGIWPWLLLGTGALAALGLVCWAGIAVWNAYGWKWRLYRRW